MLILIFSDVNDNILLYMIGDSNSNIQRISKNFMHLKLYLKTPKRLFQRNFDPCHFQRGSVDSVIFRQLDIGSLAVVWIGLDLGS